MTLLAQQMVKSDIRSPEKASESLFFELAEFKLVGSPNSDICEVWKMDLFMFFE